jgi:hypothetical protein
MTTDTITWGENYDISLSAKDADDVAIVLDETWSAACRITKFRVGGQLLVSPTMTIAAGVATATIDTGDDEWGPGEYVYDIRLTDPTGNDFWTEPVKLVLENRNSPISVPT